jgi:hypothetical protein
MTWTGAACTRAAGLALASTGLAAAAGLAGCAILDLLTSFKIG